MSLLLQANQIKKQYGVRTVLEFELFQVYEGDKIGVVGLNGAGKSTLLGILSGEIKPDEGVVDRRCRAALIRQFDENDPTLSGGENVKKRIQEETLKSDSIVFADEPTANLDREGVQWVRQKLGAARTVLLISHDRDLLDQVCNRIVEVRDGKLRAFTGGYSDYEEELRREEERQQQDYHDYQRKREQLEAAIRVQERNVASQKATKKADYRRNGSEARLGGHKRKAKIKKVERGAKVLEARMERLEQVEKPRELPKVRMDFSLTDPPRNRHVITCEGLDFSYGSHPILRDASFVIPQGGKVALTGKNGAGKTTLLNLIHQGHPAIRRVPKLKLGYLCQGFENLDPARTVLENAMADSIQDKASVRSILAGLLFYGDDVFKRVEVLSGGEKIRLSLACLLAADVNALLLDEPTNYLDIRSIRAVEQMIRDYPGTVILVSHDQRFVRHTSDSVLEIRDGKVLASRQAEAQPAPRSPADRMVLELRRTQLVTRMSSAPPEEKTALEEEYRQVLSQLRESAG